MNEVESMAPSAETGKKDNHNHNNAKPIHRTPKNEAGFLIAGAI